MYYLKIRDVLLSNEISLKIISLIKLFILNIYYRYNMKTRDKFCKLAKTEKDIVAKGMFYHDFSSLGFETFTRFYTIENQIKKDEFIIPYLDYAIDNYDIENGIELFCADGYFSNYMAQSNIMMEGIDLEISECQGESTLELARCMTKVLGNDNNIEFKKKNVYDINEDYDIALCIGGLYHVEEPKLLLELLLKHTQYMVLQTVYSLDVADDYFVTPAPHWTWGCRFSYKYLENMIKESGWKIVKSNINELPENDLSSDRGSAYFLCERNSENV